MTPQPDRRSTVRIPLAGRAVVHLGDHHLACETVNLAAGGIFVVPPMRARAGLLVVVELTLPRLGRLRLSGCITREGQHAGRYGWGVRFIETPAATRALLRDFVLLELREAREARESAERSQELRASLAEVILPELGEPRGDDGVYLHVRSQKVRERQRRGGSSGSNPSVEHVDVPDLVLPAASAPGGVANARSERSPGAVHRKGAPAAQRRDTRGDAGHLARRGNEPRAHAVLAASERRESEARNPSSGTHAMIKGRTVGDAGARRARGKTAVGSASDPVGTRPIAGDSSVGVRGATRENNAVYQRSQARQRQRKHSNTLVADVDRGHDDRGRDQDARAPGEPNEAVREALAFLDRLERSK